MRNAARILAAAAVGAAVLMATLGQRPPTRPEPMEPAVITERLAGQDAAERARAIAEIRSMADADPLVAAVYLRSTWLRLLIDAREYAVADELAPRAIAAGAYDLSSVELLQRMRVTALTRAAKHDEALVQAKALYLAGSMAGTEYNMLLLAECLNAARPDSGDTDRFVREQVAGSLAPPTATGTMASTARSTVLDSIPADAASYALAIAVYHVDGRTLPTAPADLAAVGNLQLLSGRPGEARVAFERLKQVASTPTELRAANEGIARSIRAADGTVARANAWVAAMRQTR